MSAFENWLIQNDISIPPSLKKKLEENYVASAKVLAKIKKKGDNAVKEVMDKLKLDLIEEAVFEVILSTADEEGNTSGQGAGPGSQIMTIVPEIVSISDNKNGAVNIEWKLTAQRLNNNADNQVQLEWAEEEKELDFDHGEMEKFQ
eukprot:CAMPEP_0201595176 /NCGR_PEP_ID=MMETSP0190_2-20130828/192264_1 /ASSEMBLY_ACC=CAM_ASM_000263 /TAXON_ID=37353 /ORGANISM="Rosalina sp." /LENGTH=145 /DNA_ID=CAMNT_0048055069 /DNA_START=29 /DNA_END=466 /DNA_ORIENTATION=-